MAQIECLQCDSNDVVDVLVDPYDERGETFDALLCKACVNDIGGREIFRDA